MGNASLQTNSFGALLRDLRLRARLTQREFAHLVGYSAAQINRLEQGVRKPDSGVVAARFVEALGLSPDSDKAQALIQLASTVDSSIRQATPVGSLDRSSHLPAATTTIIGRDRDIDRLSALLRGSEARLITLVGPPGVGKTRLAVEVGNAVADAYSTARFVRLAPVTSAHLVPGAILAAMGIQATESDLTAALRMHFDSDRVLLLVDNFEHVLEAAAHIAELLAALPLVTVLVTSREPLHIRGEHIYTVAPLELEEASTLFLRRASALRPDLRTPGIYAQSILDICRKLDGIPLAIELAAARVRLFDPPGILSRLQSQLSFLTNGSRDLAERQRSLSSTIEWSYTLLNEHEKRVFDRLGIFPSTFGLDAAEAVAMSDLDESSVDILQSLVDKNLVAVEHHADEPRFMLLDMMREYAVRQLKLSDEYAAAAQTHARYYMDFASNGLPLIRSGHQVRWLYRFDLEQDNLRAALSHLLEIDDTHNGCALVRAMCLYWNLRGHHSEAMSWITWFLDRATEQREPVGRAHLLEMQQTFVITSQPGMTEAVTEAAINAMRGIGDVSGHARTVAERARTLRREGKFVQARADLQTSAQLLHNSDDAESYLDVLFILMPLERDMGHFEEAERLLAEIEDRVRLLDVALLTWLWTVEKAILAYTTGEVAGAYDLASKALDICTESGFAAEQQVMGWLLARPMLTRGDYEAALDVLNMAANDLQARGHKEGLNRTLPWLAFGQHLTGMRDAANSTLVSQSLTDALELNLQSKRLLVLCETLRICAWVCADRSQYEEALTLVFSAEWLSASMGGVMAAGDAAFHVPRQAECLAHVDAGTQASCRQRGESFSFEGAVRYASRVLREAAT